MVSVDNRPVIIWEQLPPDEPRELGELVDFALAYGEMAHIDPTEVFVSPFGEFLPTMPRPRRGAVDGSGRLPAGLDIVKVAWHPVFWMGASRFQRRDENEYEWHIRLFIELVALGMYNPETRRFSDPLKQYLDIDLDTDAGAVERVTRYANGFTGDVELNQFQLVLEDGMPEGWSRQEAKAMYQQAYDAYLEFVEELNGTQEANLQEAVELLRTATPTAPRDLLSGHLQKLQLGRQTQNTRREVEHLVDHLGSYLTELESSVFVVEMWVDDASRDPMPPLDRQRLLDQRLHAVSDKTDEIRNLQTALFIRGFNTQAATQLYGAVSAALDDVCGRGRQMLDRLGQTPDRQANDATLATATRGPESVRGRYSVVTTSIDPGLDED